MDISTYFWGTRDRDEPTLVYSAPIEDTWVGLYLTCLNTASHIVYYKIPYGNIGVVINCCRKRYKVPPHITLFNFPIKDIPETDIIVIAKQCIKIINHAFAKKRSVIINCRAGVSRSASIVMAFLITKGYTYKGAYNTLNSLRKCIKPNRGFVKQLKAFEPSLKN